MACNIHSFGRMSMPALGGFQCVHTAVVWRCAFLVLTIQCPKSCLVLYFRLRLDLPLSVAPQSDSVYPSQGWLRCKLPLHSQIC